MLGRLRDRVSKTSALNLNTSTPLFSIHVFLFSCGEKVHNMQILQLFFFSICVFSLQTHLYMFQPTCCNLISTRPSLTVYSLANLNEARQKVGHRAAFFSLTKISFDFKCLLFKEIEGTIAISNVNVWVGLSTCICRKRVCQDQLLCLLSSGDKIPCKVSLQLKSKFNSTFFL